MCLLSIQRSAQLDARTLTCPLAEVNGQRLILILEFFCASNKLPDRDLDGSLALRTAILHDPHDYLISIDLPEHSDNAVAGCQADGKDFSASNPARAIKLTVRFMFLLLLNSWFVYALLQSARGDGWSRTVGACTLALDNGENLRAKRKKSIAGAL